MEAILSPPLSSDINVKNGSVSQRVKGEEIKWGRVRGGAALLHLAIFLNKTTIQSSRKTFHLSLITDAHILSLCFPSHQILLLSPSNYCPISSVIRRPGLNLR